MIHTYRKMSESKWAVGYWAFVSRGKAKKEATRWIEVRSFPGETMAAAFCNYMNGGPGNFWQQTT